jgi:hypothetical protein
MALFFQQVKKKLKSLQNLQLHLKNLFPISRKEKWRSKIWKMLKGKSISLLSEAEANNLTKRKDTDMIEAVAEILGIENMTVTEIQTVTIIMSERRVYFDIN